MAGSTVIIVAEAATQGAAGEAHPEEGAHPASTSEHAGELHSETAHAEGHSDVFPPFDPAGFGPQLVWLALTFLVLYLVMSRVALPRIGGILEQRQNRVSGDLREAERLRQETERAAAAYEAALAEARGNAHTIAESTRASIRADIEGKRTAVETDLSRRMAEAETRIAATKAEALRNVDIIAAETAVAVVQQLSGSVSVEEARAAVAAAASGSVGR